MMEWVIILSVEQLCTYLAIVKCCPMNTLLFSKCNSHLYVMVDHCIRIDDFLENRDYLMLMTQTVRIMGLNAGLWIGY